MSCSMGTILPALCDIGVNYEIMILFANALVNHCVIFYSSVVVV